MPDFNHTTSLSPKYTFLSGGGEMGKLIRSKDWSNTMLGVPGTWPQSLRTTLGIVLSSKFPMFLWWGPKLLCFYNVAYRTCLGENGKNPDIVGMPAKKAWSEICPNIKPLIDQVLESGEAVCREDQLIPGYHNGKIEDVYWTFNYIPVNDESEKPGGVLVLCSDTTEKITGLKKAGNSKQQYKNVNNGQVYDHTKPGTITETINEITAQKNFKISLSESEKKFRNTVMQAPVGITVLRGPSFICLLYTSDAADE